LNNADMENCAPPFSVCRRQRQEVEGQSVWSKRECVRCAERNSCAACLRFIEFLRCVGGGKPNHGYYGEAESTRSIYYASRPIANRQRPPHDKSQRGIAERALRLAFPHTQTFLRPGFQYGYWRRSRLDRTGPLSGLEQVTREDTKSVSLHYQRRSRSSSWASVPKPLPLAGTGHSGFSWFSRRRRSGEVSGAQPRRSGASEEQLSVRGKGGKPAACRYLRKPPTVDHTC